MDNLESARSTLQARQVRALHFYDPTPAAGRKAVHRPDHRVDRTGPTGAGGVGGLGASEQDADSGSGGENGGPPAFLPNIPTEELFTTPHRLRVDGRTRTSPPPASPSGAKWQKSHSASKRGAWSSFRRVKARRYTSSSSPSMGRATWAKWRLWMCPRPSSRAASSTTIPFSMKTPPATSPSARPTRSALLGAPSCRPMSWRPPASTSPTCTWTS